MPNVAFEYKAKPQEDKKDELEELRKEVLKEIDYRYDLLKQGNCNTNHVMREIRERLDEIKKIDKLRK